MPVVNLTDETNTPIAQYDATKDEAYQPEETTKPEKTSTKTPDKLANKRYALVAVCSLGGLILGVKFSPEKTLGAVGGLVVGAVAGNWIAQKYIN